MCPGAVSSDQTPDEYGQLTKTHPADAKNEKFMVFEGLSDEGEVLDGDDSANGGEGLVGDEGMPISEP